MVLNVAAAYWPSADEVVLEFNTTEDDLQTTTLADSVLFSLMLETKDQIGTKTYSQLAKQKITSDYAGSDKSYKMRFRNPQRRMDLFLDVTATFGVTTYTKRTKIGISDTPKQNIDLPDNVLWDHDPLDFMSTQGSDDLMPENVVVLAPELRAYVKDFNFFEPQPPETYEDLTYTGGALKRLLLNSQTNSFQNQENRPPYLIPAFFFLENAAENFIGNAFFIDTADQLPVGWTLDSAGAVTQTDVVYDHQTSSDAKLWKIRIRQQNQFSSFDSIKLSYVDFVPVTAAENYVWSSYLRVKKFGASTIVRDAKYIIDWYDSTNLLSTTEVTLPTSDFASFNIGSVQGEAPAGAVKAKVRLEIKQVNSGDDVEITMFAPQFEEGFYPTTRMLDDRLQDLLTIPNYNAANQKIRFQMVMGFADTITANREFTSGPLTITFEPAGLIRVTLSTYGEITTTLAYSVGTFLDLTIAHSSNGKLQLYREGDLVVETTLGVIPSSPQPLIVQGIGLELLRLNFFNRI